MVVNTKSPRKALLIFTLALASFGVLGTYIYYGYYQELQALDKLSSSNDQERLEAGEYLVSIQSKKAVEYWEELIVNVCSFYSTRGFNEEYSGPKLDPWVIKFLNQVKPEGEEVIKNLLNHETSRVVGYTLNFIGELGNDARQYCDTVLEIHQKPVHADDSYYFVDILSKIGPHRSDVFKVILKYIRTGDRQTKIKAQRSIDRFLIYPQLKPFTKLNQLLKELPSKDKVLLTEYLSAAFISLIGNRNFEFQSIPESKQLFPTLLNILKTEPSASTGDLIYLLQELPPAGFIEYENEILTIFSSAQFQIKFQLLELYPNVPLAIKNSMKNHISSTVKLNQINEFNSLLVDDALKPELTAHYLNQLNSDQQKTVIDLLIKEHFSSQLIELSDYIKGQDKLSEISSILQNHLNTETNDNGKFINFTFSLTEAKATIDKQIEVQSNGNLSEPIFYEYLINLILSLNKTEKLKLLNYIQETNFLNKIKFEPPIEPALDWIDFFSSFVQTEKIYHHPVTNKLYAIILKHLKQSQDLKPYFIKTLKQNDDFEIDCLIEQCIVLSIKDKEITEGINKIDNEDVNEHLLSFWRWWHSLGKDTNSAEKAKRFLFRNPSYYSFAIALPPDTKSERTQLFEALTSLLFSDVDAEIDLDEYQTVSTLAKMLFNFGVEYSPYMRKLFDKLDKKPLQALCINYLSRFSKFNDLDIPRLKELAYDDSVPQITFYETVKVLISLGENDPKFQEFVIKKFEDIGLYEIYELFSALDNCLIKTEKLIPYYELLLRGSKLKMRLLGVELLKQNESYLAEFENILNYTIKYRTYVNDFLYQEETYLNDNVNLDTLLKYFGTKLPKVNQTIESLLDNQTTWDLNSVKLLNSLIATGFNRPKALTLTKEHLFKIFETDDEDDGSIKISNFSPPAFELIPFLINILNSKKNEGELVMALNHLSSFGLKAKEAIPAIQKLLQQNPNSYVGKESAEALTEIQGH